MSRASEAVEPVAGRGADHEGLVEAKRGVEPRPRAPAASAAPRVDLVEDEQLRLPAFAERLQDRLGLLGHGRMACLFPGVDQERQHVGVRRRAPGGGDHRPVEAALRREEARRVDEHDLRLACGQHAAHGRARRLRLARDDRHLVADERVDERRLARVGRADQRDEAASRLRSRRAPAVEKGLRGGLFGGAFRTGRALFRLEAFEHHAHDEMGRVRRAAALDLLVAGRAKRARLGPFLHRGLGVARGLRVRGDAVAPRARG